MELPILPKKHRQLEADFGIEFRRWLEKGEHYTSSIELKQTDGKDYLNFSEVKLEQILWGLGIEGTRGKLIRTRGVKGLPDYVYLKEEPSFVVIKYPEFVAIVRMPAFVKERDKGKGKSLTADRARVIATKIIE